MSATNAPTDLKGKGIETSNNDYSMGGDDDDENNNNSTDDNDSGLDDAAIEAEIEEPDDDNMEAIDTSNILGSRTRRGKSVDYAAAEQKAKAAGEIGDEEDEDEDEDFTAAEVGSGVEAGDRMEE